MRSPEVLKTFKFACPQLFMNSTILSTAGYNNKMCVQLSAHPHLYRLILWFEKEELLIQQLVMKIRSDIPVHKRKQNAITILTNDVLQCLWGDYKAGKLSAKDLLLESSKWVAKRVS